jgi:hypothetical protein
VISPRQTFGRINILTNLINEIRFDNSVLLCYAIAGGENMGLSIEQSLIVLQKFIDKHQATMDGRETMVLQWCKDLIRLADQGYWQGVQDGYDTFHLQTKLAELETKLALAKANTDATDKIQ